MIKLKVIGDWSKTNSFLERALNLVKLGELDKYGREGVRALAAATPVDTGKTAASWSYRIIRKKDSVIIEWLNSNQNEGIPIVILIQYGHGIQNGVYVKGVDFINPSMKPIFDDISEQIREELAR